MFELKYKAANDMKEAELIIKSLHTINKNMSHDLFLYAHFR